jgi:hypothetical protein
MVLLPQSVAELRQISVAQSRRAGFKPAVLKAKTVGRDAHATGQRTRLPGLCSDQQVLNPVV